MGETSNGDIRYKGSDSKIIDIWVLGYRPFYSTIFPNKYRRCV